MKKVCAVLLFSFIGMSVYARELKPTIKPTTSIVDVMKVLKEGKLKVSTTKQSLRQSARRQMMFTFYDDCGNSMNVWVSGGSGTHDASFWYTGYSYAQGCMSANGCFP